MAETSNPNNEKKSGWKRFSLKKLNKRYHFMMSHDDTMEPIVDFRVNLQRLILLTIAGVVILIALTTVIIAFTPLREYIPGYTNTELDREVYALNQKADSIREELHRKDIYFNNLKHIIEGYEVDEDSLNPMDIYSPLPGFDIDTIEIRKSVQDSVLRAEFEKANLYNLVGESNLVKHHNSSAVSFFTPLSGMVTSVYDADHGHYGTDIAAAENEIIKATLDGTVIYASWTIDFGYTIGIQHDNNYFSAYKHNATLLKKEGDHVKAGEAIAVLGESGDISTGPHLHFELWHNGMPINPEEYIDFEK